MIHPKYVHENSPQKRNSCTQLCPREFTKSSTRIHPQKMSTRHRQFWKKNVHENSLSTRSLHITNNGDFNSSPCCMLQLFQAKQRKKPWTLECNGSRTRDYIRKHFSIRLLTLEKMDFGTKNRKTATIIIDNLSLGSLKIVTDPLLSNCYEVLLDSKYRRVMADNIAYAKFRKTLLIW